MRCFLSILYKYPREIGGSPPPPHTHTHPRRSSLHSSFPPFTRSSFSLQSFSQHRSAYRGVGGGLTEKDIHVLTVSAVLRTSSRTRYIFIFECTISFKIYKNSVNPIYLVILHVHTVHNHPKYIFTVCIAFLSVHFFPFMHLQVYSFTYSTHWLCSSRCTHADDFTNYFTQPHVVSEA